MWIIAGLNRVLVWRWIRRQAGGDTSPTAERARADAAKVMMDIRGIGMVDNRLHIGATLLLHMPTADR